MNSLKVCEQISSGVIAIISIGNGPILDFAKIISNSLDVPHLSIRSETTSSSLVASNEIFDLNMHPSKDQLNKIIIDLINHYKWSFVTVLFQEPNRIEDIVNYASNDYFEHKIRFQFRILDYNKSHWPILLKDIKSTGSSHIIIDLETSLVNCFLKIVNYSFLKAI